jgi:hypothetical protein
MRKKLMDLSRSISIAAASRSTRPKPLGSKVWLSAIAFGLTLGLAALAFMVLTSAA